MAQSVSTGGGSTASRLFYGCFFNSWGEISILDFSGGSMEHGHHLNTFSLSLSLSHFILTPFLPWISCLVHFAWCFPHKRDIWVFFMFRTPSFSRGRKRDQITNGWRRHAIKKKLNLDQFSQETIYSFFFVRRLRCSHSPFGGLVFFFHPHFFPFLPHPQHPIIISRWGKRKKERGKEIFSPPFPFFFLSLSLLLL